MNSEKLRHKIAINIIGSFTLLFIVGGILFYLNKITQDYQNQINQINNSASNIKGHAIELQGRMEEAEKYKAIWGRIPENKKTTSPIKVDDLNKNLDAIAAKYNIFSKSIQISLPEDLHQGLFQRQTIDVSFSNCELSFQAISDIDSIAFISEFLNSISGYTIITSLNISKSKPKYDDSDLIDISGGKSAGIVKGKISFIWYILKDKQ